MRPILLGCAAVTMFIGGVVVAPLTSEIASPTSVVGDVIHSAPAVTVEPSTST